MPLLIVRQNIQKQKGLMRRSLFAFAPDGDVGNCLFESFAGSHRVTEEGK